MLGELGIVVSAVVGDFVTDPRGADKGLVFALKLDLGDDEAGVIAVKFVDFPGLALVLDDGTGFFDEGTDAKTEKGVGIGSGDRVLKLETGDTGGLSLNGEESLVAATADADGAALIAGEVALNVAGALAATPGVADDQEFAFDLVWHGESVRGWGGKGNRGAGEARSKDENFWKMPSDTAEHEGRPHRAPPPATTSLSPRGGALHRTLKSHILKALEEAGEKGMTADELSEDLGVLKPRIQAWFSGTGKRLEEVKKVGVGRWKYVKGKGKTL